MGCAASHTDHVHSPQKQSELTIKSAILIQNWYRRYRARLERKRRYTWMIYQSLEYAGEQDQLKLYNFFNDIIHLPGGDPANIDDVMDNNHKLLLDHEPGKDETELLKAMDYTNIPVEEAYKGPHLQFPLQISHLRALMEFYKNKQTLHVYYLTMLLCETRQALMSKPNINVVSTSISKQITICGDLHGKLDDLYIILFKNGLPDVTNPYVFNGDFVDRGQFSIEVLVTLFLLVLLFPTSVFLNRGNHEDYVMNYRYGFIKEVQAKYKVHANRLCILFRDIFSWLPLATTIDDSVFVCHGGISNKTDLEILSAIPRNSYLSTLKPPEDATQKIDFVHWKQILDVLWSDPRPQLGCKPNTFRGGGSYFGPDVTEAILKKYGFKLLIRSHECKREGYEYDHSDQLLTIFSASNYYGEDTNHGAFAKLDENLNVHIVQFSSTKKQSSRKSTGHSLNNIESAAVRDLRAKIWANKEDLLQEFWKYDQYRSGFIKLTEWCNSLSAVMSLQIPWATLRNHLVVTNNNGQVEYTSTFEKLSITHPFSEDSGTLTEQLYQNRDTLETIFRAIDKDNSGQVSLEEFKESCHLLSQHTKKTLSEETIADIAKTIDINKDGFIDFNEFLESFRIVDFQRRESLNSSLAVH